MGIASKRFRVAPLLMAAALALAVWAPSADAQRNCPSGSDSPPGNSEIDQYSENVPGPCGDQPVNPPSGGSDTPPSGSVPPGTVDDLNSLGADGQAAAALAQATAPRNQGSDDNGGEGAGGAEGLGGAAALADDIDASNGSIFDEIFDAITGSGDGGNGLGILLPIILIAALIAAVAYSRTRRPVE